MKLKSFNELTWISDEDGDDPMKLALEIIEQCAQIAEKHGHETSSIEGSRSAVKIASEIRALAGEMERK